MIQSNNCLRIISASGILFLFLIIHITAAWSEILEKPKPVKPKLIIMPFTPAPGEAYDGTGLFVQNLLENAMIVHPGFEKLLFCWKMEKIFPDASDFHEYCLGAAPDLNIMDLAETLEIRFWLTGSVRQTGEHTEVVMTLKDVDHLGADMHSYVLLDPPGYFIGIRQTLLGAVYPDGQLAINKA